MKDGFDFRSSLNDIAWPAVPRPDGAVVAALLLQLEQSQWWPAARLREMQFRQLTQLCRFAARQVPFYRDRFAALDWRPASPMTPEIWREIPLLSRDDIQAGGERLTAASLPKTHGRVTSSSTSGTSGKAITYHSSKLSGLFWEAFTLRDHFWHRRDISQPLAALRHSEKDYAPYPKGIRTRSWGAAFDRLFQAGPSVAVNLHRSPEEHLEWLQRTRAGYLIAFPSVVDHLARHCLKNRIALPDLKGVITISEVLEPATRELCREAWGVAVTDIYSARETGYLALQCPESDNYHLQSESALVEILRPDGTPCDVGETGRVVVTPLHNFAMPLIRYELGDQAELGPPCPCGRGLPVLTTILGREFHRIYLPDGRTRLATMGSENRKNLLTVAALRQFQLVQTSLHSAEVRVSTSAALTPDDEETLRQVAWSILSYPLDLTISIHDEIPRDASGKFQIFVQKYKPPD
nr:hypothetical protein [uncultured Brevundimonas sp.]